MFKKCIYILGILNLYLLIITLTISITINFSFIYNYEIDKLNLVHSTNLPKETLYKNYKYLITYLNSPKSTELSIPDFKNSYNGEYHFKQVRLLVHTNYIVNIISLFISMLFIRYSFKNNMINKIKRPIMLNMIFPIILLLIFSLNFNWFFNFFHKILFNNSYWIFNTSTDPVITMLPEKFFMDIFSASLLIYEFICIFLLFVIIAPNIIFEVCRKK